MSGVSSILGHNHLLKMQFRREKQTPRVNGAVPYFVRYSPGGGVPPILLSALLALKHDPRTLPQRDPARRPARHRRPVGCLCHLEVVDARDVIHDAVAGVVPDVHAEGEVRLGFFHGQARLDSPWPGTIYTPLLRCVRAAQNGFIEPCLPSPAPKPPDGACVAVIDRGARWLLPSTRTPNLTARFWPVWA